MKKNNNNYNNETKALLTCNTKKIYIYIRKLYIEDRNFQKKN